MIASLSANESLELPTTLSFAPKQRECLLNFVACITTIATATTAVV